MALFMRIFNLICMMFLICHWSGCLQVRDINDLIEKTKQNKNGNNHVWIKKSCVQKCERSFNQSDSYREGIIHFVWDGPCLMFFHLSSSCQCCKDFRTTAGSPSMSLRSVQNQKEIIVHKIQKKMKHENDSEWNKNSLKRRVTVRTSRWFYIVEEGLIKVSCLSPFHHLNTFGVF